MTDKNIHVLKYNFRDATTYQNERQSPGESREFTTTLEMSNHLINSNPGLMIFSLRDREGLILIANFMKIAKKMKKDSNFKVVVVDYVRDPNFETVIYKVGIKDIIDSKIDPKSLKFKIEFWMKSLIAQSRQNALLNQKKEVKSDGKTNAQDSKVNDPKSVKWKDPLDLQDDIWLIKNENDCKKVLTKWLIRLFGPGPYVGQWTEVEPTIWRFEIKEESKSRFLSGNGAWFFKGDQKPDFNWKENLWMFTGEKLDLFYKSTAGIVSRLSVRDKMLTACKNSTSAKNKENFILESFSQDLLFKYQSDNLKNMQGKNETENIDGGPLSGKSEGDILEDGPLSGKSSTDNIDNDPLSGKNQPSDVLGGNLSGKFDDSTPEYEEELSLNSPTAHESSYQEQKNNPVEEKSGSVFAPKSEDPRRGADLEAERSDVDYQKYYKNKNPYQTPTSSTNPKERKSREDEESGPSSDFSLKTETSHESSYQEQKNTPEERKSGNIFAPKSEDPPRGADLEAERSDVDYQKYYKNKNPSSSGESSGSPKERKDRERQEEESSSSSNFSLKTETSRESSFQEQKITPEDRKSGNIFSPKSEDPRRGADLDAERSDVNYQKHYKNKSSESAAPNEERSKKVDFENEEKNGPKPVFKPHTQSESGQLEQKKSSEERSSGGIFAPRPENPRAGAELTAERSEVDYQTHYKNKITPTELDNNKKSKPSRAKDDPTSRDKNYTETLNKTEKNDSDSIDDDLVDNLEDLLFSSEPDLDELTKDSKVISILTQPGVKVVCVLDDFFDNTLVFSTQNLSIGTPGKVHLDLIFRFHDEDTKLEMDANIISLDDEQGTRFINVEVEDNRLGDLTSFMDLYGKRQNNVDEFLKRTKGL